MESIRSFCKSRAFLYILLACFCLLLACSAKDYDYDLYARLLVGENFIDKGIFNYKDYLSYTPTHIWYDHEWGSSLIFYLFFKYLGPFGLILLQGITMFITSVFVIKTQRLQNNPYPVSLAFMALFLWLFFHQNPSIVRCHMFSFMFFAMFLYFLEKTRTKNANIIWLIPLITIIWNNLHGGIVSGLGLIGIYMVGAILSKKPFKKYLYVLLVSLPLLAINPYGCEYLNFLISANTKTRSYITEWWSVFAIRHVVYYYPAFCLSILTTILAFMKRNKNLIKTLALLVTTALGIWHVKLLSLSVIVAASLFYNDIMNIIGKNFIRIAEKIAYVIVFLSILYIPFSNPTIPRVEPEKYPVMETEFLRLNNIKGNILTAFGLGSYVSYKLYPDNLIYMDGRYEEVYYDREFDKLMKYELVEEGWDEVLNEYPTEILMPDKTVPVYEVLQKHPDWKEIFEGSVCGVFVRKEAAKKNYIIPPNTIDYYQETAFERVEKEVKNEQP